jgi:hypothetical protein
MTLVRELEHEIKSDLKTARKYHLPWWAIVGLIIVGIPVAAIFDHFGKLDLYLPVFNTIAAFGFVVFVKRSFWGNAWFWLTMAVVAILNAAVLLYIPWDDKWHPAMAWAGFSSIEFIAILLILDLVERFVNGKRPRAGRHREGNI